MAEKETRRIAWPDVLRALALYSVILAHLGPYSQRVSLFCFGYVMQLFFFVSGLFAASYKKLEFAELIKKLFLHLLIPHILLSAVNIAYAAYRRIPNWKDGIMQCVLSIRNKIMFPTLWYLPCLIVMIFAYWCLSKLIKNQYLRLLICLAISLAFRIYKEPSQWFWSSDSAMMFIFFFALGDVLMPVLKAVPLPGTPLWKKILFVVVVALCLVPAVFSYYVFNTQDPVLFGRVMHIRDIQIFTFVSSVATTLVLTGVSYLLHKVDALRTIGRSSILLFAIQGPATDLFTWVLWQIGVTWIPRYDWQVLFLGAARLVFSCYVFAVPVFWLFGKLKGSKK